MKVRALLKKLQGFNQDADISVVYDGMYLSPTDVCWDSNKQYENIEDEKSNATTLYLHTRNK